MVYMTFPTALTEEEKLLQKKFAELKKKKKMLAALRAPKLEPKEQNKDAAMRANDDAADNTEQAKKLIKSGAIKLAEEKRNPSTLKRKRGKEEKERAPLGFQPFSPTHNTEEEQEPEPSKATVRPLYESFERAKERVERKRPEASGEFVHPPRRGANSAAPTAAGGSGDFRGDFPVPRSRAEGNPKRGNTVYVTASGLTEELLQRVFGRVGNVVNINVQREKSVGFVTFEKMEHADQAIAELNNTMVADTQLRVSLARRQPQLPPPPSSARPEFEPATSEPKRDWASIARDKSDKGAFTDSREMVVHDDDLFQ